MILILGDSNIRNTMEKYKKSLEIQVKDVVTFEFCSSVESVRLAMSSREVAPKIVLYGSPMNEIIAKIAKNKNVGRDEMVKRVVREFVTAIGQCARDFPDALHLIVQPFMRSEPKWAEEKVTLMLHYTVDSVRTQGLNNLAVGSPIDVTAEDLSKDKIHLNDAGKEKLYGILESDINKCKEDAMEVGESSQGGLCWASQLSDTASLKTPSTLRKRARTLEHEESESDSDSRKKTRIDALFDKMDVVLKEIRDDRGKTSARVEQIETKIDAVDDKVNSVMAKVEGMEDNNLTAEMRDDIDSLENENLKSIVIVRKLKAAVDVPTDKKVLRGFIHNVARELVQDVLGDNAKDEVKYASTLYAFIDPTKKDNQKGLIPPFRIGHSCFVYYDNMN